MTDKNLKPQAPSFVAPTRVGRAMDRASARVGDGWDVVSGAVASSQVGRWFRRVEQPNLADWALLGAITVLATVTFLYADARTTWQHSFNFLDSVFAGRPQDFYQIAIENSAFGHPAVYDIPIYLVFGLWNLPTYLLYRFNDFDYLHSTPAHLWLKLMLIAFTLVAAWLMMKIARQIGVSAKRSKWVAFYFLSSLSIFVPVFVVVQYDIVALVFMLAGLLAYLRGNTRAFLLWFLVANTFKLFGLFIFIPLVLLREKRLPRAGGQIVIGLIGLLLCRLLYRGDVAFEASTGGFTDIMISRLVSGSFAWHSGISISLFVVFMIGLAIFAYAKRPTSEREVHAFALYMSLGAFLAFCVLTPLNPYWIALMAPFAVLIIFANPRFLTLNTLLETSVSSALCLIYLLVGYSMYNSGIFNFLLFGRFIPPADPQRFDTPGDILRAAGVNGNILVLLVGFMFACALAVMIVNYPRASFIEGMPNNQTIKRSVIWIRIAALVGFCSLLFAMYLIPARPVAYSSTSPSPALTDVDVLAPGSVVEEELTFDSPISVDIMEIGMDASAATWINSAAVTATILDSSGNSVFEGAAPMNAIGTGLAQFRTGGLVLEADETYTLRLEGRDSEGDPVFVQINPEQNRFPTTENGKTIDGDLVMILNGSVG